MQGYYKAREVSSNYGTAEAVPFQRRVLRYRKETADPLHFACHTPSKPSPSASLYARLQRIYSASYGHCNGVVLLSLLYPKERP